MSITSRMLAIFWLTCLLVAGAYLRIHGVGDYYYSLDEVGNVAMSKGSLHNVLQYFRFETHPAFPALLRHGMMMISDAPALMRGYAVFFGVLSILAYYKVGKLAGGTLAGCIAAYLMAFGTGNIVMSQVVRNYTLLVFLIAIAFYCYRRFMQTEKPSWVLGYAAAALLAQMTHYSAVFAVVSMGSVCAFVLVRRHRSLSNAWWVWVAANAAVALYFGYQYVTDIHANGYALEFITYPDKASEAMDKSFSFMMMRLLLYVPASVSYILHTRGYDPFNIPAICFFFVAFAFLFKRDRLLFCETLLALSLGAVLTMMKMYPVAAIIGGRQAMWAMPYVILPMAVFFADVTRNVMATLDAKRVRAVITPLAIVAFLLAGFATNPAREFFISGEYLISNEGMREMKALLARLTPRDAIVTGKADVIYALPDDVNIYELLAGAKEGAKYNSVTVAGGARALYHLHYARLYTQPILADFISELVNHHELTNTQTLWFINTMWPALWVEPLLACAKIPMKRYAFPKTPDASLGEHAPKITLFSVNKDAFLRDVIAEDGKYNHCLQSGP